MTNVITFWHRIFQRILKLRDYALVLTSLYSVVMFFVVCYLLYRSPSSVSRSEDDGHRRFRFKHSSEFDRDDDSQIEVTTPRSKNTGYFFLDTNLTFTERCKRCSLVSSSGHLYQSGAGADIDSADCVLRMNTAPVTGWTEDVGSRTDMRIIGHVNLPRGLVAKASLRQEILKNPNTRAKYIIVPWLYKDKVDMQTHKVVQLARDFKEEFPEVDFVFLTKKKYEESERRFKLETGFSRTEIHTWFSTGFVSMMFALDVCDKVQVYGLSTIEFCTRHPDSKVPYHYYEPHKMTECAFQRSNELGLARGHKFMTERAMFARWSLIYDITFHYPSWKATIENATGNLDTPFLRKYKEALKNGKLDEVPQYVFKNGKRYRVIYRRVVRKAANSALQNDTAPGNDTAGIGKKAPEDEKSLPQVNMSQGKDQNQTINKEVSHVPRKKKKIIKKVMRRKRNQT